jgi:hypothetical protein
MPVDARHFIRRLQGGAQAHLLEAADGHYYVVKFINNPQHRRILTNEWLASAFLRLLGIATPEVAIVRVSAEFLKQNPDAHVQRGTHREALRPGWQFGSRYPGSPAAAGVYDSIPAALLDRVENLDEFLGVLAFDKWVGNADSRQAVFFDPNARPWPHMSEALSHHNGLVAQMIDNGHIFEGGDWRFSDSPLRGLYFRRAVYSSVRGLSCFEPWLGLIVNFREGFVDKALKEVPGSWLAGDEGEIERLLEKLMRRRKRVPELIEASFSADANLFPNWRVNRH